MLRLIITFLGLSVAQHSVAQQLSLSPIVGGKFDITRIPFNERHLVIPDYSVIDQESYWFIPNKRPLFGARFEYCFQKHNVSAGVIVNDYVNHKFGYRFLAIENGQTVEVNQRTVLGVRTTKIPIAYGYRWFNTKGEKFSFNFHLGVNFVIPKKSATYSLVETKSNIMAEGLSAGKEIIIDTYILSSEAFTKSRFKTTFEIGFDLKFKINERIHINACLYFEKGLRNAGISASDVDFQIDGYNVLRMGSGSSGTALHFKFMVPILIKDLKK
jgi:hypothetical protein